MDKQEDNNIKLLVSRLKKGLLLPLAILFMLSACKQSDENTIKTTGNSAAESTVRTAQEDTRQQGREVILIRGNEWVNGIPGFEVNSFYALTGEYRLRTAGAGGGKEFTVYLSKEPIYFSEEWEMRRGMGTMQAVQRSANEGFMAAVTVDDGKGVLWTAVFLFPLGLDGSLFNDDSFNQMLRVWLNRFLYFLSLARTTGDLSIPAVVEF